YLEHFFFFKTTATHKILPLSIRRRRKFCKRDGSLYARRGAEPLTVPAPHVTAVDTTAAGDTFVGALAVALGEGRPVQQALIWASAAAALCVQRPGASTSMPYRTEIDAS
ncbi:PfkB family carbohydrate kinase, partial [Streptomyces lunaelactis]|uniref:PfkB family carbohydrate kinase n=1 Tax=Streptomyces lunaelactis TaxID=1535768 RepID=UPI0020C80605